MIISRGKKTATASQLNTSCTVAPANARRKSFLFVICPIETIVFVTDVPILAPITIGTANFTVSTESIEETIIVMIYSGFKS